ncbi:DJ-1/PfpI family protein [Streptomyces lasiicapitis]|uniref:Thimanine synthesis protein ThiJ n=1 Tax=Streptomyces lasiicapitis TaxID=1923961 RepID=A0ABQ2LSN4_9ACTN|nr:DJ-1/PfpI family protein [Streptomyces lasiicapitis]GGO42566.1 thimanine synthesis protein ThiJ [Streptomyces lasiicapitis]
MDRRGLLRSTAAVGAAGATVAWGAGAGVAQARGRKPLRVHIVVFDGVEELDFAGPLEVFGAARSVGQPVETKLVTSGGAGGFTGRFGTRVTGVGAWEPGAADVVVVPGGGFGQRDGAGIWAEIKKGRLTRALREAARPDLTLLGVCTGVVVLHAAGLIGGRPCTTHHRAKDYLREQGADVRDARVVDDGGDLVCAGGVSSGIDGALWVLERAVGSAAVGQVESLMEFERRGTVLRT